MIEFSENYRKIGNSLYERHGNAFVHVAIVPKVCKNLKQAVRWYNDD